MEHIVAFPVQHWFRKRATFYTFYVHCLSCLFSYEEARVELQQYVLSVVTIVRFAFPYFQYV